jgi:hypothetical protein
MGLYKGLDGVGDLEVTETGLRLQKQGNCGFDSKLNKWLFGLSELKVN